MNKLPDGSAFSVGSLPLPKDHWLYAPRSEGWDDQRDCGADVPLPVLNHTEHRDAVVAAVRYAIRGATFCGQDQDFDPDALVLNAVYALCGPHGSAASINDDVVDPDFDPVTDCFAPASDYVPIPLMLDVDTVEARKEQYERWRARNPAATHMDAYWAREVTLPEGWQLVPKDMPFGTLAACHVSPYEWAHVLANAPTPIVAPPTKESSALSIALEALQFYADNKHWYEGMDCFGGGSYLREFGDKARTAIAVINAAPTPPIASQAVEAASLSQIAGDLWDASINCDFDAFKQHVANALPTQAKGE